MSINTTKIFVFLGLFISTLALAENRYFGDGDLSDAVIEVNGSSATLYLASRKTNEPLVDVEPEFEPFADEVENVKFIKTENAGIYRAQVEPTLVFEGQIIFETKAGTEAVPLNADPANAKPGTAGAHAGAAEVRGTLLSHSLVAGGLVLAFVLGALSVCFLLLRRRNFHVRGERMIVDLDEKKSSNEKIALLLVLALAPFHRMPDAQAHAGHSHDGPEASAAGNGTSVKLAKKSQFLMGLRTVEMTRTPLSASVGTFGHIVANPQLDANITAPANGVVTLNPNVQWGELVRKGQVIAQLASIGNVPITAPLSGRLLEIKVASGKRVEAGEPLFRVVDTSKLWVDAELFEKDLSKVSGAKEALISVQGTEARFEGRVLNATTPIDEGSLTAKVYVEIENPNNDLRLGSYVGISFLSQETTETFMVVPRDAVLYRGADRIVFVKTGAESFAAKAIVSREHPDPNYLIVEKGLDEKDLVVVKGNYQLLVGLN